MSIKKKELSRAVTQKSKAISQELKEIFLKRMEYTDYEPKKPLVAFAEGLLRLSNEKNVEKRKEMELEIDKNAQKALSALSLESKHKLVRAVDEDDRSFALQMSRELEEEFDVRTPSERALVQMATLAFCRMQRYARLFRVHDQPEWLSHEAAHFVSLYGKEIDRSNRHFITAIQALKQLKTPPLNVRVTTKTAFVAQNQQNISNVNPENNAPQ